MHNSPPNRNGPRPSSQITNTRNQGRARRTARKQKTKCSARLTIPPPRFRISVMVMTFTCAGNYLTRLGKKYLVLSKTNYEYFLRLIQAALRTQTGLTDFGVSASAGRHNVYKAIQTIRDAIDQAIGTGMGLKLIPEPTNGKYYLNLVKDACSINPNLAELTGAIDANLILDLLQPRVEGCRISDMIQTPGISGSESQD